MRNKILKKYLINWKKKKVVSHWLVLKENMVIQALRKTK